MEIKLPNDFGNIKHLGGSSDSIESPFELNAEGFIKFAEEDIVGNKDKDIINALGNIKRAIENRVDLLHYAFGYKNLKENGDFPTKLERLNELGIVAPRILRKINKIRNLLEHQYKLPDKEEIEDAIDVAILFVEYTNKFIYNFVDDFEASCKDTDLFICFEENKLNVIFSSSEHDDFSLTNRDLEYSEWVKLIVKTGY